MTNSETDSAKAPGTPPEQAANVKPTTRRSKFISSGQSIGGLWFEVRVVQIEGFEPNAFPIITVRSKHQAGEVLWRGMADDFKAGDLRKVADSLDQAREAVRDANRSKADQPSEDARS